MKRNLLLGLVLIASFFSVSSNAGTTVCAGLTVHYSLNRLDFGAPPPSGTYAGEEFLSVKGILKEQRTFFVGMESPNPWNLNLNIRNRQELFHSGSQSAGYTVYAALLTSVDPGSQTSLQEPVTCKETWAYVP